MIIPDSPCKAITSNKASIYLDRMSSEFRMSINIATGATIMLPILGIYAASNISVCSIPRVTQAKRKKKPSRCISI